MLKLKRWCKESKPTLIDNKTLLKCLSFMGRLILYNGVSLDENISAPYQQTKISEYELLTKYNPKYINSKIKLAQSHISEMYHLSTSITTCDDIMGSDFCLISS